MSYLHGLSSQERETWKNELARAHLLVSLEALLKELSKPKTRLPREVWHFDPWHFEQPNPLWDKPTPS